MKTKNFIKVNPPKLRKGQKCFLCKKIISGSFCYNGYYWHDKCKEKDSNRRIKEFISSLKKDII